MANHDWVDERIAALTPDRAWTPNSARTFSRLRTRAVRFRRWVWTSAVATAACITLFLFPAPRACAEQPGPCVLRVLGVAPAPATLEVSPEFRATFDRDILPRLTDPWIVSGKMKVVYRDQDSPIILTHNGESEVVAPIDLEKRLHSTLGQ
ncbi:MAG TPA: hypothetical protein VHC72_08510 [Bryobacteraceae bacterium]|nr:hypothetical protein [Bryobacteraceae bacterium]